MLIKQEKRELLGDVAFDDEIIVTSADQSVQVVYFIEFLEMQSGSKAYVTSDVLDVDQLQKMISGIPENTLYNIFLGLIEPARGASVIILDDQQQAVTSGIIENGYTLQVTSGDGLTVVSYNLSILTRFNQPVFTQLKVYPNPATDRIFIEGVGVGNYLVIKNISGQTVKIAYHKDIVNGSISVEDLTPGVYMIFEVSNNQYSVPVKFIKL